uniref:Gfo/Idh/MocA-like oxidoreductase N-terminal domain-containing protein n=1 Tax=Bicosoecida sp. CB-2014 TaxID=1486930 RepID=A0A7S1G6D8_9STRA|mmetsp:Transcript_17027/g.59653  ORF Transcript_17027/g.59653 Transcript_17027/m.59653 type:complete len:511 (+) Transcript_17027:199-1731(+)
MALVGRVVAATRAGAHGLRLNIAARSTVVGRASMSSAAGGAGGGGSSSPRRGARGPSTTAAASGTAAAAGSGPPGSPSAADDAHHSHGSKGTRRGYASTAADRTGVLRRQWSTWAEATIDCAGADSVNFVVAGTGLPGKGMGWAHIRQIVDGAIDKRATAYAAVEPHYLGLLGAGRPPVPVSEADAMRSFDAMRRGLRAKSRLELVPRFGEIAPLPSPSIAILAGRTPDQPKLFAEAIAAGASHVLLEKPGADSVEALLALKRVAARAGVGVCVNFQKHVSKYAQAARRAATAAGAGARVTYVHTNDVEATEAALSECFARNSEGLVKNMAIHELALLVDFHDVTADNVVRVEVDPEGAPWATQRLTLDGRTDFARVAVTLHTADGRAASVFADRCAPRNSARALVHDASGELVLESVAECGAVEGDATAACLTEQETTSYLREQWHDYAAVKRAMVDHILAGGTDAPVGLATLDTAVGAMRLAELVTRELTAHFDAADAGAGAGAEASA